MKVLILLLFISKFVTLSLILLPLLKSITWVLLVSIILELENQSIISNCLMKITLFRYQHYILIYLLFCVCQNDVLIIWRVDHLLSTRLLESFHLYTGTYLLLVNINFFWNFDNTQIVGYLNYNLIGEGSIHSPPCYYSLPNFLFPYLLCNKIFIGINKIINKVYHYSHEFITVLEHRSLV